MKIILVDDHSIVRKGLKLLIESKQKDYKIKEVSSGKEAIDVIEVFKPDVIITDISMPDMTGHELIKEVRKNNVDVKILVFSMHLEEDYIKDAMEFGANGYLCKEMDDDNEIIWGLEAVMQGKKYFGNKISQILVGNMFERSPKVELANREIQVIQLIAEGYVYKEIADQLDISVRTVETHRKNILEKLDMRTNADLIKYAIKEKLVKL